VAELEGIQASLAAVAERLQLEKKFSDSLLEIAQVIVLILDTEGHIVRINKFMEDLSGYRSDEVVGKSWFETFLPERDREAIRVVFSRAVSDIQTRGSVNSILTKGGREVEIAWYDRTIKSIGGQTRGVLCIGVDVTERKRLEKQLQDALTKALSGFIPICAGCKRIRRKEGAWEQVETYVRERTDAEFTHSICPICEEELYGDTA
jgi:hypothetical protein